MGQTSSQPEIQQLQNLQTTKQQFKIAVICGSLRRQSTNAGLVRAVYETKDTRFYFHWIEIINFPVFNEDIEASGYPADVQLARNIVGKADAILFAVPEYNTTISSPLKNAYDWLSREDKNKFCPVADKLAAMISSAAVTGGVKAQEHMRLSVSYRKLNVMTPSKDAQIFVKRFNGKFFDERGSLIDEDTKKRIKLFLNEFYNFIKTNKK